MQNPYALYTYKYFIHKPESALENTTHTIPSDF